MTTKFNLQEDEIMPEMQEQQQEEQQQEQLLLSTIFKGDCEFLDERTFNLQEDEIMQEIQEQQEEQQQEPLLLSLILNGDCEGEFLDERTIFIANLDVHVTEKLLYEVFVPAGPIEQVKILKYFDGPENIFAIVIFEHRLSPPNAMSLLRGGVANFTLPPINDQSCDNLAFSGANDAGYMETTPSSLRQQNLEHWYVSSPTRSSPSSNSKNLEHSYVSSPTRRSSPSSNSFKRRPNKRSYSVDHNDDKQWPKKRRASLGHYDDKGQSSLF